MTKKYEKLVSEFRKQGLLKKYVGIADAHGIESFLTEEKAKAEGFLTIAYLRANTNRQRHAVFYTVELTQDRVDEIEKLLSNNKFEEALITLKKLAVTIGFPVGDDMTYRNSWKLIPNPRLDPHRIVKELN